MFVIRHNKIVLLYTIYLILFTISLFFLITFVSHFNLNSSIDGIKKYIQDNNGNNQQTLDLINKNLYGVSKIKALFFITGYAGFTKIYQFAPNSLFLYALNCCIFFPILLILAFFLVVNLIFIYAISKIRRDYKYYLLKSISKWGFIISGSLLTAFYIASSSWLLTLNKYFSHDFYKIWYGKADVSKDVISNFSIFSMLINFNTLIGKSSDNNIAQLIADSHITATYSQFHSFAAFAIVSLSILVPITLFFCGSFIACYLSKRDGGMISDLSDWLGNVRIDSMREYRDAFFKNWHFWVMSGVSFISLLIPTLLHNYSNKISITISYLFIILYITTYIPLLISFIRIKQIASTSYNTHMFVMINAQLWFSVLSQIIGFMLLRDVMVVPLVFAFYQPIIIIAVLMTTIILFIRSKGR